MNSKINLNYTLVNRKSAVARLSDKDACSFRVRN